MVPFLEQRLDSRITKGATFDVQQPSRLKIYTATQRLTQLFQSATPIHVMNVAHGVRSQADFQTLLDLFYVVMFTPYLGFRAKDWRDFLATPANSALAFVSGTSWQLQRVHRSGSVEWRRAIYKPVVGTVQVQRTRSGVPSVAEEAVVDYTTGLVGLSAHTAGDTYTWLGEFDLPVTFSDNEWTATLETPTQNLYVTSGDIKLEEIRL